MNIMMPVSTGDVNGHMNMLFLGQILNQPPAFLANSKESIQLTLTNSIAQEPIYDQSRRDNSRESSAGSKHGDSSHLKTEAFASHVPSKQSLLNNSQHRFILLPNLREEQLFNVQFPMSNPSSKQINLQIHPSKERHTTEPQPINHDTFFAHPQDLRMDIQVNKDMNIIKAPYTAQTELERNTIQTHSQASEEGDAQQASVVMRSKGLHIASNYDGAESAESMINLFENYSPSFVNIAGFKIGGNNVQQPSTSTVVLSHQNGAPYICKEFSYNFQGFDPNRLQTELLTEKSLPKPSLGSLKSFKTFQKEGTDSKSKTDSSERKRIETHESYVRQKNRNNELTAKRASSAAKINQDLKAILPLVFEYGGSLSKQPSFRSREPQTHESPKAPTITPEMRRNSHQLSVKIPAQAQMSPSKEREPNKNEQMSRRNSTYLDNNNETQKISENSSESSQPKFEVKIFKNQKKTEGKKHWIASNLSLKDQILDTLIGQKKNSSILSPEKPKLDEDLDIPKQEQVTLTRKVVEIKQKVHQRYSSTKKRLYDTPSPGTIYQAESVVVSRIASGPKGTLKRGVTTQSGQLNDKSPDLVEQKTVLLEQTTSARKQQDTKKMNAQKINSQNADGTNTMSVSLTESNTKAIMSSLPKQDLAIRALYVTFKNHEHGYSDRQQKFQQTLSQVTNDDDYVMPSITIQPTLPLEIKGTTVITNKSQTQNPPSRLQQKKQRPSNLKIPVLNNAQQHEIQNLQNLMQSKPSARVTSTRKISAVYDQENAPTKDVDVMNQGVGTQDLGELYLDSSPEFKTDVDLVPQQLKEMISTLAQNIDLQIRKTLPNRPKPIKRSRLQRVLRLIQAGKLMPQASCLCVELGLEPDQFVRVVNSYLKKPRVIVKDGPNSHKVLHLTDDGSQKDHGMIVKLMNESMQIEGENIKEIIKRNPGMQGPHSLNHEPESARKMSSSLNDFLGQARDLNPVEMPIINPYKSLTHSKEFSREDVVTEKADLRASLAKDGSKQSNSNPPETINNSLELTPIKNNEHRPMTVSNPFNDQLAYGKICKDKRQTVKSVVKEGKSEMSGEIAMQRSHKLAQSTSEEGTFETHQNDESQYLHQKIDLKANEVISNQDSKYRKPVLPTPSMMSSDIAGIKTPKLKKIQHMCAGLQTGMPMNNPNGNPTPLELKRISQEQVSTARRESSVNDLTPYDNRLGESKKSANCTPLKKAKNFKDFSTFITTHQVKQKHTINDNSKSHLDRKTRTRSYESEENFLVAKYKKPSSTHGFKQSQTKVKDRYSSIPISKVADIESVRQPDPETKARREITIIQSKKGMIASISKQFSKAKESKSTQMLQRLKTEARMTFHNNQRINAQQQNTRSQSRDSDKHLRSQGNFFVEPNSQISSLYQRTQVSFRPTLNQKLTRQPSDQMAMELVTNNFTTTEFKSIQSSVVAPSNENTKRISTNQPSREGLEVVQVKTVNDIKVNVQAKTSAPMIIQEEKQETVSTVFSKTQRIFAKPDLVQKQPTSRDTGTPERLYQFELDRQRIKLQPNPDIAVFADQFFVHPHVLNINESFISEQIDLTKRVQSQSLMQRPKAYLQKRLSRQNKISQKEAKNHINPGQLQQRLSHLGNVSNMTDNLQRQNSLESQVSKPLKPMSLIHRPLINPELAYNTDGFSKPSGHNRSEMLTYTDLQISRKNASSTSASLKPFDQTLHQFPKLLDRQDFQLRKGQQMTQTEFTNNDQVRQRIMQKSANAFYSTWKKVKKGVAGTGQSVFEQKQDGIRLIH